jgi:hypothetical protein
VIAAPHNDRSCLDAITAVVMDLVESNDPTLVALAEEHQSSQGLARWIRSLPQRDDTGLDHDGPRIEECRPAQRLRIPAADPNCVERGAVYLGVAELLDPRPIRRLATVETASGPHTFPTEDGEPVILDPLQSRNALRAGLFRATQARNGNAAIELTPDQVIDWIAEVAEEPASRFVDGRRRVRNAHRALRALLGGRPLRVADIRDVAYMLALAGREAAMFGKVGPKVVRTAVLVVDGLDRRNARSWMARARPRNVFEFRLGGLRIKPNTRLLGALGRVGGRLGYQVGLEALRTKLATMGIAGPVLESIERELKREGLSLGPLARPAPIVGSLGALSPEALAGRWLARQI